jgi:PAS domain S-box-containing protein
MASDPSSPLVRTSLPSPATESQTATPDSSSPPQHDSSQLALIADNAPVYVAHCDRDSRYLFVNKTYAARFGLKPQDCIGKHISEVVGEAAYQSFRQHVETVLQGIPVQFETEIPYPSGNRFMHASYVPDFDSEGKVRAFVAAITDVTELKRAGEALRISQEETRRQFAELEAIYATSPLGLCLLDTDLRFRRINPRLAELNGFSVEEHIGRYVRELLPAVADKAEQMMRQILETGEPIRFELRGETPAQPGVQRVWDESWYPIRDATGQITAVGVVVEEITERIKAEEALRKADRISAAGKMAATVAHEINNPLASVVNSLYLLGNEPLTDTARNYLEMARAELQRVVHITRQTLAFHRTADSPTVFNISALAGEVASAFQPVAKTQSVELEFTSEGAHFMHGFAGEIRQVLTNLVTNSLEAESSSVKLRVRHSRDWGIPERRGVRITLADDGKGIRKEHLHSIFEPFFTTKGEKGTGLGLWVTRGIVGKHEGNIRIRSTAAKGRSGTCISMFLPTLVAHIPKSHPAATSSTVA